MTEGDLFPGGIASFGVTSGPGSVTVDHVNAGTGLQSLTVVGTPTNAVVVIPPFTPGTQAPVTVTFTPINPGLGVDFTLRAASTFHAIFIRVRCADTCTPSTTVTEGDLFPGGIASFGITSGPGTVTVDHVNAGTGLQSLTVVGTPTNAVVMIPPFAPGTTAPVVVTFFVPNPSMPVDFTLRAASTFHAVFIRARCGSANSPAAVSGRVLTPDGRGLRNAKVVITGPDGSSRAVTTGSFGNYSFDDVEFGRNYVIGVVSSKYTFASRVLPVFAPLMDVDFVGNQ